MKKISLIILLFCGIIIAQNNFTVENVKGEAKILKGNSEQWIELQNNQTIDNNAIISTGKNSSLKLVGNDVSINLKEESAISVSDIKKMNMDELLLALAVEEILDAPQKNKDSKSENTAVYGSDEKERKNAVINSDDFGFKRLNGAVQLSENGMPESAVVVAKEVYRKYPSTKKDVNLRIYFADILYEKGLYEEAMVEYKGLQEMNLSEKQKEGIQKKLASIKKKLLSE
jgi:hypothetical protein